MKENSILATFAAVATLMLSGCNNDMNTSPAEDAVRFSADIDYSGKTRVSGELGNVWDNTDEIGIYMYTSAWGDAKSNAHYTYAGTGSNFNPATDGDKFTYPGKGVEVNFVAYYPYKEDLPASNVYPVNVSDQTKNIDLMYAPAVTQSTGTVALTFSHKLSRVILTVTADDPAADLAGMATVITGMPTTADFDLVAANPAVSGQGDVAPIRAKLISAVEGAPARVEAIVLPGEGITYSVKFTLADGTEAGYTMEGKTFVPGKQYKYNVTLDILDKTASIASEGIDGWDAGNEGGEDVETTKE